MRTPPKPKPQAFEEVARVLNVYDMLREELRQRHPSPVGTVQIGEPVRLDHAAILVVAAGIAARTEG